ncbi:DUF2510 domain-containing protein [Leifsonia sp. Leaf264]|uniref:DUF2510 domain-containing protein n=1 Tax=Leifsonia sp. Leaf264 TaxID=1736314 RepID=UPI0006F838A6|nr:DUF2510 domain-containing protein [Leifsonia sp. Leaf264]KQO94490.1 hypothetical protein ASF30_21160 [Leifsonia sp. Leaf264]
MSTPPPGWYADPAAAHDPTVPATALRWWDGSAWTGHTHVPAPPAPVAAQAPAAAHAPVAAFAPVIGPGSPTVAAAVTSPVTDASTTAPDAAASVPLGTGERNPFSLLALIFGIAAVAAAALVALTAVSVLATIAAGALAVLFGILGIVRSFRTRTGRAASVWGTVLGPVGVVAAGIVWIVAVIATPNLGIPFVDYVDQEPEAAQQDALSASAEHLIMTDLRSVAVDDPTQQFPETVECPVAVAPTEGWFQCAITFEDGSTNIAFVTELPTGELMWQPAELGEVGE